MLPLARGPGFLAQAPAAPAREAPMSTHDTLSSALKRADIPWLATYLEADPPAPAALRRFFHHGPRVRHLALLSIRERLPLCRDRATLEGYAGLLPLDL